MGRTTLSHRAFRTGVFARPPSCEHSLERLASDARLGSLTISRRQMVTFAGTVALASSAGVRAATASLSATEVTADRYGVRALVAGRRFELDARRFGGNPHIEVSRDDSSVTATLKSATYPGTDIPADLTLRFESLDGNTRLRIRTAAGGFEATVPLLAWLEGRAKARSRMRLTGIRSALGDGRALRFKGTAIATLHPDLTLDLVGDNIVSVRGRGLSVAGSGAHIWLASASAHTLFTHRIRRRTFIQVLRGDHRWRVNGIVTRTGNTLDFQPDSFDQATVEAAQTRSGQRLAILSFENSRHAGAAGLKLASGGPAASLLPLDNPRYAFICGDHDRFSLTADVSDAVTWLERKGYSLLLGKHPESPQVVMRGAGSTADQVEAQTEVLGVSVPLEGVISSPIMLSPTTTDTGADPSVAARQIQSFSPETHAPAPMSDYVVTPIPGFYLDAASVQVTRPDDMFTVTFEFFNLRLIVDHADGPRLVRRESTAPCFLVAEFPPQALLEQAFEENGGLIDMLLRIPPIGARIAGPTRLALTIPADKAVEGIPYTLEGLLDWTGYNHSVVPAARGVGSILRRPQTGSHYMAVRPETSIEAPWGLFLSPSVSRERWSHRVHPFTAGGVTELWHTNLIGSVYADRPFGRPYYHPPKVRVVWTRGYRDMEPQPDLDFKNSLTHDAGTDLTGKLNRWTLVDITAKHQKPPVNVDRLTLSPLGAWIDVRGGWPTDQYMLEPGGGPYATSLLAWEHRATMARDQFVRIVIAGRIFPFGHRAALVTITERKFTGTPTAKSTGYTLQRRFIVIREFEREYRFGASARDRQSPFKKVILKTRETPLLKQPSESRVSHPTISGTAGMAFWPTVRETGGTFQFEYTAIDWDGREIEMSSPLIFLEENWAVKTNSPPCTPAPPPINCIPVDLSREIDICERAMGEQIISLNGQQLAYSEPLPSSATRDRRVLETLSIRLRAENAVSSAVSNGMIFFYPKLHRAQVRLEDVEALMNADTAGTPIKLWDFYVNNGYGGTNAQGRVFAEIADSLPITTTPPPDANPLALDIPPEKAGGFATPNLAVTGLSATGGAFGGKADQYGSGSVDALDFFANANPTLFGDITLLDILRVGANQGVSLGLEDVPRFNDYIVERNGQRIARYEYSWETEEFGNQSTIFKKSTSPTPKTKLTLLAFLEKNLSSAVAPVSSGVSGTLSNFTLSLFEIIEVEFTSFAFGVNAGGDVDVTPDIKDIRFSGALEFVNQLREIMNFTSSDGGFAIDINAEGISAIVTIALPDIAVGIFSLKNMSISAGLKLRFDGEPLRFPFYFCKPESPFELAVSGFGGGGYFIVELQASDTKAIALLELSLEFGVCCSVTLAGIASGSVEIKGGVMIRIEGDALTFMAFFRMAGRLDILGIIKVSVVFELKLTYMNKTAAGKPHAILIGEASLTIDIEILFFSFSVRLTVSKEFEGDDPRFGEWMLEDEWATYCDAFGPATVGA